MCITDSLLCTAKTNTTLQINHTPIKLIKILKTKVYRMLKKNKETNYKSNIIE